LGAPSKVSEYERRIHHLEELAEKHTIQIQAMQNTITELMNAQRTKKVDEAERMDVHEAMALAN
jgi:hypothetical protein